MHCWPIPGDLLGLPTGDSRVGTRVILALALSQGVHSVQSISSNFA
jgi:hypothetical protein